jgi:hypothetical protein
MQHINSAKVKISIDSNQKLIERVLELTHQILGCQSGTGTSTQNC